MSTLYIVANPVMSSVGYGEYTTGMLWIFDFIEQGDTIVFS